jgi:hypothetical protein
MQTEGPIHLPSGLRFFKRARSILRLVRRVTDGRRIDVFSREAREGFAQYGNEIGKFAICHAGVATPFAPSEQLDIEKAIAAAPAPDGEIPDLPRCLRRA